jgi:hypothetical protein
VRVNGTRASKPATSVGPGDVLTFAQARAIRVIRIVGVGVRRGPATEAQALYDDLDPPGDAPRPEPAPRAGPRPTKKARRASTTCGTPKPDLRRNGPCCGREMSLANCQLKFTLVGQTDGPAAALAHLASDKGVT